MKKKITTITAICVLTAGILSMSGCASLNRFNKTIKSDFSNGLNRTVTVYDYNGNPIKSWTGKFDLEQNDQETYFDLDGKRVIVQGGITICEEN